MLAADASAEGESSKIAFNSKYLQDVLKVLSDGKVALETRGVSQLDLIHPGRALRAATQLRQARAVAP